MKTANEKAKVEPFPYVRAEGPVPSDVWEHSTRIASDEAHTNGDGIPYRHVRRTPSGALYLQEASAVGGWLFFPAVDTREFEK